MKYYSNSTLDTFTHVKDFIILIALTPELRICIHNSVFADLSVVVCDLSVAVYNYR